MMTSKHVFSASISGASLKLRLVIFDDRFFPALKVQELSKLIEDFLAKHQEDVVQLYEHGSDTENDVSYWQSRRGEQE